MVVRDGGFPSLLGLQGSLCRGWHGPLRRKNWKWMQCLVPNSESRVQMVTGVPVPQVDRDLAWGPVALGLVGWGQEPRGQVSSIGLCAHSQSPV